MESRLMSRWKLQMENTGAEEMSLGTGNDFGLGLAAFDMSQLTFIDSLSARYCMEYFTYVISYVTLHQLLTGKVINPHYS